MDRNGKARMNPYTLVKRT